MTDISKNDDARHKRELNATIAQIKAFNQKVYKGWRLEIPVWKLAIEGAVLFLLAFMMGLGFAVLFEIIRK